MPIQAPREPRVYVAVEGQSGQLVIDGPLTLLRDLLTAVQPPNAGEDRRRGALKEAGDASTH